MRCTVCDERAAFLTVTGAMCGPHALEAFVTSSSESMWFPVRFREAVEYTPTLQGAE
jgi:hypothetical protein